MAWINIRLIGIPILYMDEVRFALKQRTGPTIRRG